MATTGTYSATLNVGEGILNALSRIKLRGSDVTATHTRMAVQEANLMQAEWSNRGPNLWAVDLQTVTIIPGRASYSVPPETVMILDAYIQTGTGPSTNNRIITPVSRTEWASYPNPYQLSPPTTYWFDRLIAPTINLYPTPDASQAYTLCYWRYRQIQDAALGGGINFEIPYLWLDAACAGLAARLAKHFAAIDVEVKREADADKAYKIAATNNVEAADFYISPMVGGYYS